MRRLAALGLGALLYGVIALGANPAFAGDLSAADVAALKTLRTGDMNKLVFHDKPRARINESFKDIDGNEIRIADFEGRIVVLNFWATWCPPCRAEMPSIDRLAAGMADQDIAVIALSTDRLDISRVAAFFKEIGVENLPVLHDQRGKVARGAAALGLPLTLILNREGREIARLQGGAEWDAPEVKAILTRLIEMTAPRT